MADYGWQDDSGAGGRRPPVGSRPNTFQPAIATNGLQASCRQTADLCNGGGSGGGRSHSHLDSNFFFHRPTVSPTTEPKNRRALAGVNGPRPGTFSNFFLHCPIRCSNFPCSTQKNSQITYRPAVNTNGPPVRLIWLSLNGKWGHPASYPFFPCLSFFRTWSPTSPFNHPAPLYRE